MEEPLNKLRILVTGSTGQLGRELKELLQHRRDYTSIFLSRADLDLTDLKAIIPELSKWKPDVIIHVAAYTAVDLAEEQPELADRVNHLAVGEIAAYCRLRKGGCKLILVSTDYVFSGDNAGKLREDDLTEPLSIYGKTKLLGEIAAIREFPESLIIRTSWLYSTYGNNFVKTMLRLMMKMEDLRVVDDQIGLPTYARDLARAIVRVVEQQVRPAGIYHYANLGDGISWYDFAQEIKRFNEFGVRLDRVTSKEFGAKAPRPKFSVLDTQKIRVVYDVDIPYWRDSLHEVLGKLSKELGL